MRGGYLTLGRWRGAPVRAHWTLLVGALVFGQGRFVPGFWLGFFLLVLVHELGHAIMVRWQRQRVVSIDIHGLGGLCRWSGDPTALARAWIAWGGVMAQAVALVATYAALAVLGPPETVFTMQLEAAFTTTNIWLIAINLMPVAPLDGAEAWKLPALLSRRQETARYDKETRKGGFEAERETATLDRFSGEGPAAVKTAVEDALRRLGEGPKKPRD